MKWFRCALLGAAAFAIAYATLAVNARAKRWKSEELVANRLAADCVAGHSSYEQWHARSVIPYKSPIAELEWERRYRQLAIGQTRDEVARAMGEPDYVQAVWAKERPQFRICSWTYEVHRRLDEANDKQNSYIEVFFDSSGKMKGKDAVNVGGIPQRPLPSATNR